MHQQNSWIDRQRPCQVDPLLYSSGAFLAIGVGDPVQSDGFYSSLCAFGSFAPVDPLDLEADGDALAG